MPELIRNAPEDWAPQVGGYILNKRIVIPLELLVWELCSYVVSVIIAQL